MRRWLRYIHVNVSPRQTPRRHGRHTYTPTHQQLLESLSGHLVVNRVRRDLDVAGTTLLQDVLEDLVKCVGPGGRVTRLDIVEERLGARERARHGGERREGRGEVEGMVEQRRRRLHCSFSSITVFLQYNTKVPTCMALLGAPTMCSTGTLSASAPAIPLHCRRCTCHWYHGLGRTTAHSARRRRRS